MALRLLRYCVNILEEAYREDPKRTRLPPVLPVVVHQGKRPWPYPTSLDGILGETVRTLPWGPRLDYLLLDQGADGTSTVSGTALGRLVQYLMLVASGPKSEKAAAFERGVALMQDLSLAERPNDLEALFSYVFGGKEESAMMKALEEML